MNLDKMKEELIASIDQLEDEERLKQILEILEEYESKPNIEQIFEEAKAQYGNTLKKLSE